ncbi:NAD-binding protein [Streptomyces sp. NPDC051664]|uniref:NAD-binding protein n=1 Tax=Streptomyces sp. NPDC051664 TaxID=3365668 RepID=UPI0037B67568
MGLGPRSQHMVIGGDDGLARRPAVELDAVCGEAVTVVLPSRRDEHGAEIAALHRDPRSPIELLVAARLDEQTLRAAGVQRAAALALTYADDQVNMTAALLARGLNPSVRLVIRMFNCERGRHLERLLDRAAAEARAGNHDDPRPDMSTTVLRPSRSGYRVVPATTRRGLDILMTGVQPHPADRDEVCRFRRHRCCGHPTILRCGTSCDGRGGLSPGRTPKRRAALARP